LFPPLLAVEEATGLLDTCLMLRVAAGSTPGRGRLGQMGQVVLST
jgi:hypothetical protein